MTVSSVRVGLGWVVGCAALLAAASAVAEPVAPRSAPTGLTTRDGVPGVRLIVPVEVPDQPTTRSAPAAPADVSRVIYLERCKGAGCNVAMGPNDARGGTSTVPKKNGVISEFEDFSGAVSPTSNTEWDRIVQCVREVYSPFNVTVTDQKPATGTYHEAIVAGAPVEIGMENNVLGVAPLANDCRAIDNAISFSFANVHPPQAPMSQPTAANITERILNICWTVSQESAHAFGLDHEFQFAASGRSACNDPMTYSVDCGGQKFFRNEAASCGEYAVRACTCPGQQNSHAKLLSVFGAGTPITGNPTIALSSFATGGQLDRSIVAMAGSKRGVAKVQLLLNGYKWLELPGVPFGALGQPNPASYAAVVPTEVPNSIVDVKMVAYDDLGAATETAVATATRGAPCAAADTCLKGQKCEAGKCFWDPPVGELGDVCAYPQFCKSNMCQGTKSEQICTTTCATAVAGSCPDGLVCTSNDPKAAQGICFFEQSDSGCCSVDRGNGGWLHLGVGAAVLGFVLRRRRVR